jgi:hypothetical protein
VRDELSPYARLIDCLPEGVTPVGFVVAIEVMDANGDLYLHVRGSETIPPWKGVGMLINASDQLRDDMRTPYVRVIVDEDGEDDLAG